MLVHPAAYYRDRRMHLNSSAAAVIAYVFILLWLLLPLMCSVRNIPFYALYPYLSVRVEPVVERFGLLLWVKVSSRCTLHA